MWNIHSRSDHAINPADGCPLRLSAEENGFGILKGSLASFRPNELPLLFVLAERKCMVWTNIPGECPTCRIYYMEGLEQFVIRCSQGGSTADISRKIDANASRETPFLWVGVANSLEKTLLPKCMPPPFPMIPFQLRGIIAGFGFKINGESTLWLNDGTSLYWSTHLVYV